MSLLIEMDQEVFARPPALRVIDGDIHEVPEEHFADEVEVEGAWYRPHRNGGGLVSVDAFCGARVFVGENAMVKDCAIVIDDVRVLDSAVIEGCAHVSGRCELRHESGVSGFATLSGMVSLRHHARVSGTARLDGGIMLDHHVHIARGHLIGSLLIG